MTETQTNSRYAPTLHDDHTVTYWRVYRQSWQQRVGYVPAQELAAMSHETREQVIRHLSGHRTWYVTVGFGSCRLPSVIALDQNTVKAAMQTAAEEDPSGWTEAHARVYGYRLKSQALLADIADDIGQRGRVI